MPPARKRNTGALGQVAEWEVWVELVVQSRGWLHVFLPLLDRGIDALVHRLSDGAWLPLQVKSAATQRSASIVVNVPDAGLVEDDAYIVAGLVDGDRLASRLLVIRERDFKRLAGRSMQRGEGEHKRLAPAHEGNIPLFSDRVTRWSPYILDRDRLAPALLAARLPAVAHARLRSPRARADTRIVGFKGEMEVVRRLSDVDELEVYRPFPDLETAEVVARHGTTHRVVGLQVKTISVDAARPFNTVHVYIDSFRPAADTWIAVLAWRRDARCFSDDFLLIPSLDVKRIGSRSGKQWTFQYAPGDAKYHVARYAHRLYALGSVIESLIASHSGTSAR